MFEKNGEQVEKKSIKQLSIPLDKQSTVADLKAKIAEMSGNPLIDPQQLILANLHPKKGEIETRFISKQSC